MKVCKKACSVALNCILDESNTNTRKLDKKFITSVMERRYAHL